MDLTQIQYNEIHDKLLELAKYFDSFCKENGIEYYLHGGTALGAIRHKGFIPWDDDFDVQMTKDNYDKFIELAKTKLDTDRFYLQRENTDEWPLFFSKLRMNGTTYIEEYCGNRDMHKGFFIDISCVYNCYDNKLMNYLQYVAGRLLVGQSLWRRGYVTDNWVKKTIVFICGIIVRGMVKKWITDFVNSLSLIHTRFVRHLFTASRFSKVCFPREYYGEPRMIEFEGLFFPVMREVELYLAAVYGNYMDLPNEKEKKKYRPHVVFYKTEVDYSEYD